MNYDVSPKEMIDYDEYRQLTIIGLLQVGVIFMGFLIVFMWTKFLGYTVGCTHIRKTAIFVREQGVWLFLIPLSWILLSLWYECKTNDDDGLSRGLGIMILMFLILFFIITVVTAFRPSFLQQVVR